MHYQLHSSHREAAHYGRPRVCIGLAMDFEIGHVTGSKISRLCDPARRTSGYTHVIRTTQYAIKEVFDVDHSRKLTTAGSINRRILPAYGFVVYRGEVPCTGPI
ncbi:MAG: hypothetical protein Fur005_37650 [Roseiflexaceae bacterium]